MHGSAHGARMPRQPPATECAAKNAGFSSAECAPTPHRLHVACSGVPSATPAPRLSAPHRACMSLVPCCMYRCDPSRAGTGALRLCGAHKRRPGRIQVDHGARVLHIACCLLPVACCIPAARILLMFTKGMMMSMMRPAMLITGIAMLVTCCMLHDTRYCNDRRSTSSQA